MDDDDSLIRQGYAGVDLGYRGIVPGRDLAQVNSGDDLGSELQFALEPGDIVRRYDSSQNRRQMDDLHLSACQLFIGHGAITSSEVNRASSHLTNTATASNGLEVDLNIRMFLVILVKPLGIDRIGKGSTRCVQLGLRSQWQNQQERREHWVELSQD